MMTRRLGQKCVVCVVCYIMSFIISLVARITSLSISSLMCIFKVKVVRHPLYIIYDKPILRVFYLYFTIWVDFAVDNFTGHVDRMRIYDYAIYTAKYILS